MADVNRYSYRTIDTNIGTYEEWELDPEGDWVKWEDVQRLLAELEELRKTQVEKP